MELDPKQRKQIMDLVILLLEGEASGEDFQKLKDLLDASSEARDYYLKALMAVECIRKIDWEALNFESEYAQYETINAQMWDALSLEEKTAPNVEIPVISREPAEEKVLTGTRTARPNISKLSLFSLLLSSAALIFVIAYGTIVSMKKGVEVATLTDSLEAGWAEPTMFIPKNGRLSTEQRFALTNGFAAVKTDQGVELTFEAPAEFKMMSNGDLQLKSGQVYARVSPQGFGFTVNTPNSKIIDLGTEFGVRAEAAGSSDVYVFKGKVQLFAGPKEQAKTGLVVMENKAVRYDAASRRIDEIPFEEQGFVRLIDSKTKITWRGVTQIDLADIVGGGNGFGNGKLLYGIHTGTGKSMLYDGSHNNLRFKATNAYHLCMEHPFVDGVFVPNSMEGPQIITSQRHTFLSCPKTNGEYYMGIINGRGIDSNDTSTEGVLSLCGIKYGTMSNSAISIHANQGITFDLHAIRKGLNGKRLLRFSSICGLCDRGISAGLADIYVLVDGHLRFSQKNITEGQSFPIDISLSPQDSFLTLITVTSENKVKPIFNGREELLNFADWCIFGDPKIVLEN